MKSPYDWRQVRRFSLRKLSIGLVSATIGLAVIGGASQEQIVLANQTATQAQQAQVTVTYDYVPYENLTAEQKAVLRDSKDFPKEIAQKDTHYLLVYQQDKGLVSLPQTGDQPGLYGLLAGLGIMAVLVAVTKRHKKLSARVLIVTAISGAALTAANGQALETGLRAFLTETHLVHLGQALPQPQARIGERTFVYYMPQISGEQASPAVKDKEKPATVIEQPATPDTPIQPEQPTLPAEPTQPEVPTEVAQPTQPESPTEVAQPTQPEVPTEVSQPTQPESPTEVAQPIQPESPTEVSQPTQPESPTEVAQPTQPEVPTEVSQPTQPESPTEVAQPTQPEVPTEVSQPIQPESPTEIDQPSQPESPTEVAQPPQPEVPTEVDQPTQPESPTEVDQPTQPEVPTEVEQPTQPESPTEVDQPTQPEVPTEVEQPIQPEAPTEVDQPTQPEAPTEVDQPTQPEAPTEVDQPTQPESPTEVAPPTQPEAPTEVDQPSQPEDTTLPTEPSQLAPSPEIAQPSQPDQAETHKGPLEGVLAVEEEKPEFPLEQVKTEPVDFKTISTPDDNLWDDETVVDVPGQAGSVSYIVLDDVRQVLAETAPVTQEQRVGTKPVEGMVPVETKVPVSTDEVTYEDSDELYVGDEVTVSDAVAGEATVITTYKTIRGEKTDEVVGTPVETVTAQPTPAKVKRGTKPVEGTIPIPTTLPVTTEEIEYVDSEDLYLGETEEISPAVPGVKTIVTTYKTIRGEQTNEVVGTPVESITVQPTPKVVKRGTKPVEGMVPVEAKVPVSTDEVIYEDSDELYDGEEVTVSDAGAGEATVITTYKTIRGEKTDEVIGTPVETITNSPKAKVVKRGTKPIEGIIPVPTTLPITTEEIEYVDSEDLYLGETEEISPAVPGVKTIVTTYKTIRGEKTEEVVGTPVETITTEPKPARVKRGTKVATEAEKQEPKPLKQTVQVGDNPQAELSIDTSLLTNVASYTWKTAPDTSQVAGNVSGTVLVTYTDQSTDDVPVLVDVIKDKTKPILTLATLTEQDDDKKITLNYDLEDPTAAYVSAKFEIFDGDRLVKSQSIDSFDAFDVAGLDWFIPYTLKTSLTYNLGNGEQSEIVSERPFELEYKRVEIKHVDRVELYEKQDDGSYRLVEELASAPAAWSNYYAKVIDDKQKDTYLAIKASEEADVDGKPVFKLTATAPQLIEYTGQGTENREDYHFYVPKTQVYTDGKIRSFEELITAMRANPAGLYELGDDLDATKFNLASNEASYIPGNFNGRLLGNNHHIKGLTAPLFNNLTGEFEVKDLGLTEVNINMPNTVGVGSLAKEANAGAGKVTNVAVQGSIVGNRSVGGLIYMARNTAFENVSFEGTIATTNGWQANITGGLVGYLRNASSLNKGTVNATITVDANQNPGSFHVGLISGSVGEGGGNFTTPISNVVASGSVVNKSATQARVAGLVGSLTTTGRLSNAVGQVTVTNGQPILGAKLTAGTPDPADTVVALDATADSSAIAQKETEMGITVDMANFIKPDINKYDVDYSKVAGYQASNDLKYANTEKLLPFYNKEVIVKQANRMTSGKLATTAIVSVVPLADKEVVADFAGRKTEINKLLVHYADGSVETLDVTYKEDFRDTAIAEYSIAGTDLIYTPNQLTTNYQETVDQIQAALAGIDYYAPSLLQVMNKDTAGSSVTELMDKLYLKDSFNEVKANLGDFLKSALATSNILTIDNHDLTKYILDNKEALLLGMSYINRWYNFNFGDIKAKDLLLSFQDFNGKTSDSLEWLIGLGRSGYDALNPTNNISTYSSKIAPQTGHADLMSFLSANRKALTTYETDNDWFKATSKAHIVEGKSKVLPDQDVTAFSLLSTANERNGLLPLLTTRGETFVITNMGGITYGMYDRYYNYEKVKAAATQEEKEAVIKAMVDQASIWQRDHFDFWYRNAPENVRDRLLKPMITWDGYQIPNGGPWLPMTGETAVNAIQDFFGPIGSRAHFGNNGAGAVANGTTIYFMFDQVLSQYGSSVFTHEAVHNNDGSIYLGGFGRRFGQRAELFATGLLQVPTNHAATGLGINTMYDYAALGYEHADNRYQALSPERFQTPADLQEFYHGTFDVLYTLDYAEAQVILNTLTSEQQSAYFNKIENYYVNDVGTGAQTHAGNAIRRFTPEEWAGLNIRTIDDLIDHNIVTHREHSVTAGQNRSELGRNGYYEDGMFSPIYAALSNSTGAPGDLMFRRIAFELLAEKGYEDGFIPYTSDKLANIAKERGSTGTETWGGTRTVGNVTDKVVLDVVFEGKYKTWADFKKAMFRQRIEKVGSLKPVTITYKEQSITLSSYQDIEKLLKEALEEDLRRFGVGAKSPSDANNRNYARDSRVKEVKAKIYNAYLRQTDDFRSSIYKP